MASSAWQKLWRKDPHVLLIHFPHSGAPLLLTTPQNPFPPVRKIGCVQLQTLQSVYSVWQVNSLIRSQRCASSLVSSHSYSIILPSPCCVSLRNTICDHIFISNFKCQVSMLSGTFLFTLEHMNPSLFARLLIWIHFSPHAECGPCSSPGDGGNPLELCINCQKHLTKINVYPGVQTDSNKLTHG